MKFCFVKNVGIIALFRGYLWKNKPFIAEQDLCVEFFDVPITKKQTGKRKQKKSVTLINNLIVFYTVIWNLHRI